MSEPPRLRGHRRAALSVLALAVAVTTCRDAPSGPSGQRGFVNISPVFTAGMNPAAFGITIDSLRAVVVRPPTDTLVDRTVAFPADSSALELGLSVLLQAPVETLTVHLQYLGAGLLLFTGSADVEVTTGVPGDEPPVEIPVGEYVGPGRDADSIVVTPADSIVSWGDSLRFRVAAFQAGVPLTQFFVSWTSTDPINAPVNGAGVLRAPSRRDTVFVIARTPPTSVRPGGVVDSVAVTFMPLPAAIAIVSGNGQSGSTGAPLAEALRVRVTATDGGGVAFARVRFRVALGGGSVADTLVIADDRGFAQTLATLGLTVGAQVFEASLDASRFVTFNASAIAGQAVRLEFTQQPGATTAGIALTPAVQVTARDTAGAIAAGFTGPVTVALLANPGGATLGGTATVNAVAGVASFGDLVLDRTSAGYTLLATAPSLAADTSAAFSVVAAAATQLVFTTQPASAIAGTAIPVVVTARDAFGNTATGFTGNVAIAIAANPGTGTLSGTATVAAVSGIATFATLSIDKVGTGYTLSATAGALPAATSAAFNISPAAASQLAFTAQPTTAVAGAAIAPAVAVTVRDAFGNTATGFAGSVTVAIGTNPGTGTLSGTATAAAVAGVATFGTLSIDKVGTGYTLTATSGTLTAATSAGFSITPAAAAELVFTTPPVTSVAGVAIPVTVTARDAFGNTATGFSGDVVVAIGTNPGGGTLAGTDTVAAVSGVATFSTLSIDKVGAGYTLVATAASLVPDTSAAFTITPAAASQLVFTAEPTTAVAGVAIAPDVIVEALDPFGNLATGFTGSVAVAIGTNPGGGTLAGTDTVAAVSGVATFSTLAIDKVGAGYTLVATAASLAPDTSAVFNISPAAASQLAFTTPPVTTVVGVAIPVVVTARDAFGNTATGFSGGVTLALGANPGGSTFGNPTVSAV
ncbi:MAG TPA: hypothetical protein VD813_02960, partial [Pseudonocardia sp.]|nr:hypothetical protein [Pseudonocardia sp.]